MVKIALRAAREAGELIARAFADIDNLKIEAKGKNDYVTQVDTAAEKLIIKALRKAYPDHSIQAEESGLNIGRDPESDYVWIIDPLDGTTNFIHGVPHFAVSIACQHKGRIEHAVVFDPIRDEAFTASRGRGAALNDMRMRVTKHKGLEGALLGTGFPFKPSQMHNMDAYMGMFRTLATQTAGIRRAGAASLDLAYVAAGRFDAFWEFGLAEWDMAAGALLITEAGGLVGDFTGSHQHLEKGQIIAGNPKCFKPLLSAIQPHLNDSLRGIE